VLCISTSFVGASIALWTPRHLLCHGRRAARHFPSDSTYWARERWDAGAVSTERWHYLKVRPCISFDIIWCSMNIVKELSTGSSICSSQKSFIQFTWNYPDQTRFQTRSWTILNSTCTLNNVMVLLMGHCWMHLLQTMTCHDIGVEKVTSPQIFLLHANFLFNSVICWVDGRVVLQIVEYLKMLSEQILWSLLTHTIFLMQDFPCVMPCWYHIEVCDIILKNGLRLGRGSVGFDLVYLMGCWNILLGQRTTKSFLIFATHHCYNFLFLNDDCISFTHDSDLIAIDSFLMT